VATISFDRVDLVRPVFHGDLVRVEGEVISMGNSSMAIHVCGFRHDLETNKYQHTHSGIVTMVAIDRFGRSRKGLPRLFDEDRAEHCTAMHATAQQRLALASRWRQDQASVDTLPHIKADQIRMLVEGKEAFASVRDTELELRKWFLPKNLNVNQTLFGGDLLTWMDKAAVYCARNFAKNDMMVTIAMNRVLFKLPILATDVVTLKARVVNVRYVLFTIPVWRSVDLRWCLPGATALKSKSRCL
jgi:acyl-CoA hydrolase